MRIKRLRFTGHSFQETFILYYDRAEGRVRHCAIVSDYVEESQNLSNFAMKSLKQYKETL